MRKEDEEIAATYSIEPATAEDIDWIASLEAEAYSPEDAVPRSILGEWYDTNPEGFSLVRMNGEKIGHIDILPLRAKALRLFIDGAIIERELRGDSLYTPEEREFIRDLYVESIIIHPLGGRSNASGIAVMHLLYNFILLTKRMADPDKIENIYAIAASKDGEHFMGKLGFELAKRGQERKDQHNLYVARFAELKVRISNLFKRRPRYTRSQID